MKKILLPALTVLVIVVAMLLTGVLFVVDQRQTALVIQFGKITREIRDPGLYFKVPMIQQITYFERRLLTLDDGEPTRITTQEKSDMLVDLFIRWRIVNASPFYTQLRSVANAQSRISQVINARVREEFGRRSMSALISGERDDVMNTLRASASKELEGFGIEIVDVRLKGVELPPNVLESAFDRMRAERLRVANERRASGAAESESIRADADKQSQVITATAFGEAESLRGLGDAESTRIYAQAFGKDPEFFSFYRSLGLYRESLGKNGDILVLDPNSRLFQHFQSGGR
jgi:membrane protease subunit HflC